MTKCKEAMMQKWTWEAVQEFVKDTTAYKIDAFFRDTVGPIRWIRDIIYMEVVR